MRQPTTQDVLSALIHLVHKEHDGEVRIDVTGLHDVQYGLAAAFDVTPATDETPEKRELVIAAKPVKTEDKPRIITHLN